MTTTTDAATPTSTDAATPTPGATRPGADAVGATPAATRDSRTPHPGRDPLAHSPLDDVLGILTGTVIASIGIFLLKSSGAVTGGTAGLALLVSYVVPVPFGVIFLAVNLPFFALAAWRKGWNFTLRTAASVALVSAFSLLNPLALVIDRLDPVYAAIAGNLLAGVGLLVLFRHRASLGGFNILALLAQERLGWRAGYVQMGLDVAIVLVSFAVVAPLTVLLSAAGAVVLNLVLAVNHRPGRYLGA
ncbi:YitT family protein [Herbiconiux moechotypicola]|uniref:YitT family protein n=1 Tax=Herbiconiux moechotypicola TaxID=637393 RepID=A0ABP5Q392_9MICO|nr:YitT family protein [Herbiconiux moechotypicola]MCS5729093.1 YitT family protein [Herbiconiux moechotypicola]